MIYITKLNLLLFLLAEGVAKILLAISKLSQPVYRDLLQLITPIQIKFKLIKKRLAPLLNLCYTYLMKNTTHYPIHQLLHSTVEYHNSKAPSSVTGHWSGRRLVIKRIEKHNEELGLITALVSDLDDQGTDKYRNLYLDRLKVVGPSEEEKRWATFNV